MTELPRDVSAERIVEAAKFIDPVFLDTPIVTSPALDKRVGRPVLIKDESANPIGSFKGRGADNFCQIHAKSGSRLVCASAGNFGQGLAWGARRAGANVVVFAATTASPIKVERMRALGAEVRLEGADFDAANAAAKRFAADSGLPFVEDAAFPEIAEGAGTIARELTQAGLDFDAIVVPVGGAALINGIGTWLKHARPTVEVVGVCAAGAPAYKLSFDAGRLIVSDKIETIADGIAVREPVETALRTMRRVVDRALLVPDDEILAAMRLLYETTGLVAEGTTGAALAVLLRQSNIAPGRPVVIPNCGANLTIEQKKTWLGIG
ncbi:MAG: pyridoxal-phosphate dependent enzyme [Hyphomicrobiaceae bacterium]